MPKLRTHRGAAKRFGRSASGRFKHRRGFRNHILTKKSTKRKRQLRSPAFVSASDAGMLQRMMPYS